MFWSEHSYIEYSTTYIGYSTLRRKSAFLCRIKISAVPDALEQPEEARASAEAGILRVLRTAL